MFLNAAIVLLLIVLALLAFAATRPDRFQVERSIAIAAPAERIFALVNDFHNWSAWTPYNKDPAMTRLFSGSPSGIGAIYEWEGNAQVGKGSIEITESQAAAKILCKLDFIRPFVAHNIAEFHFSSAGETTTVTWRMHGPQPFMGKLMSLFFNVDKMVGKDFEKGLGQLKNVAEAA